MGEIPMTDASKETLGFKTEVKQLLHLMIHSLYSNKEIFLRELISNASDACDKLRFAALQNDQLFEGQAELAVHIDFDSNARTLTIAKSGTAEFLGQFGVGFYSAFIVADKVTVETRRAGEEADQGIRWESSGEGDFCVEAITKVDRGTRIVLHLKEGEEEFADNFRLRSLF